MVDRPKVQKPIWKRWWLWAIIVVVIAAAAANGGGEDGAPAATSDGNKPATSQPKEPEPMPGLGEQVEVGELVYTVAEVKTAKEIGEGFLTKETTDLYVLAHVTVTNNGKEAVMVDTSMFTLIDDQGREFSADGVADSYVNGQLAFFLQKANPGTTKSGWVVFETPDGVEGLQLQVRNRSIGGKKALINLGQ